MNMIRNIIYQLTLVVLLSACSWSIANFPGGNSLADSNLSVVESRPTSSTSQEKIPSTLIPSCENLNKMMLKIMPLGDSITYGDGDLGNGGYRNLLGTLLVNDGYMVDFVGSQKNGEDVIPDPDNEGHPGWRILNIKQGIDTNNWLETYQPDIILLHIGSNDLRYGNGIYAPENLSTLLDDIIKRLPQTHIIVAQIIPTLWGMDSDHHSYNDAIPGVIAPKGVNVSMVDMRYILSKSDFITLYHPNTDGYNKMAYAWESAILALDLEAGCLNPK